MCLDYQRITSLIGNITSFEPKLIFLVNSDSGIPIDACLSPESRAYLQSLAVNTGDLIHKDESALANEEASQEGKEASKRGKSSQYQLEDRLSSYVDNAVTQLGDTNDYHQVEIPLRHDHEFFQTLKLGVLRINALQTDQKVELTKEIGQLAGEIAEIATPSETSAKTDMYVWREIFSLYTNCQIFFSTSEQDKHTRDLRTAERQLQHFSTKLRDVKATLKFRRKESHLALHSFLHLNLMLLCNLKFQELNITATTKILKSKQ